MGIVNTVREGRYVQRGMTPGVSTTVRKKHSVNQTRGLGLQKSGPDGPEKVSERTFSSRRRGASLFFGGAAVRIRTDAEKGGFKGRFIWGNVKKAQSAPASYSRGAVELRRGGGNRNGKKNIRERESKFFPRRKQLQKRV